jgi:hypothetical protein
MVRPASWPRTDVTVIPAWRATSTTPTGSASGAQRSSRLRVAGLPCAASRDSPAASHGSLGSTDVADACSTRRPMVFVDREENLVVHVPSKVQRMRRPYAALLQPRSRGGQRPAWYWRFSFVTVEVASARSVGGRPSPVRADFCGCRRSVILGCCGACGVVGVRSCPLVSCERYTLTAG